MTKKNIAKHPPINNPTHKSNPFSFFFFVISFFPQTDSICITRKTVQITSQILLSPINFRQDKFKQKKLCSIFTAIPNGQGYKLSLN